MKVKVLTIFPEMFPGPLGVSITGRALEEGLWSLEAINIRDFAEDRHKTVDDSPYGGGPGMVMKPDILGKSIDSALNGLESPVMVYPSPRGPHFSQKHAREWARRDMLVLCGRFEGVDQRVLDEYNFQEVSLGDFVLSGGEMAAYAMLDCTVRLLPGVVGDEASIAEESFGESKEFHNLLEYPQYTKPAIWRDKQVPSVLVSGNHAEINRWRLEQAKKLTAERRPDLFQECLQNQNKKV